MYTVSSSYSPEAMTAGARKLHDISGYITGVPHCFITISQTYQITRYVMAGQLLARPRDYLDDYTLIVSNRSGYADEIEGNAFEILQFLRELQRHPAE